MAERLVRQRTTLGLTQKRAAAEIGVDPATLARWERGEREPTGVWLGWVERFSGNGTCREAASGVDFSTGRRSVLPWPARAINLSNRRSRIDDDPL